MAALLCLNTRAHGLWDRALELVGRIALNEVRTRKLSEFLRADEAVRIETLWRSYPLIHNIDVSCHGHSVDSVFGLSYLFAGIGLACRHPRSGVLPLVHYLVAELGR